MYRKYKSKMDSLSPVAVKLGQHEVHAPGHDHWGVVTCDKCGETFAIGPNRIYGAQLDERACAQQFERLLAQDHRRDEVHADAYEIPG